MRRKFILGVAVLVLAGISVAFAMEKQVTVTFSDGKPDISVKTWQGTLEEALTAAHVDVQQLKERYRPSIPWNEPITEDQRVQLTRVYRVTLTVGGEEAVVKTEQPTVSGLLQERNITLGKWDEVNVPLESQIRDHMTVVVDRIEKKIKTKKDTIPFETIRKEDADLKKGKEVLAQKGVPGKRVIEVTYTYENGTLVEKEEQIVAEKKPVNEIVMIGTKRENSIHNSKKKTDSGIKLASRKQPSSGGTIAGRAYSKVLTVTSTAYTNDSITYTGVKPRRGTVAVDPSVIPLGTRLYIPGYGFGIAQDTGGAIKGNKIDVFVNSYDEAYRWGIRTVKVYILK